VRLAVTPLGEAPLPSVIVRRYRGEPSPLVRNGDGSWRSGRLAAVLRGDFDLLTAAEPTERTLR
jgi:hypothetical protein